MNIKTIYIQAVAPLQSNSKLMIFISSMQKYLYKQHQKNNFFFCFMQQQPKISPKCFLEHHLPKQ